MGTPVLRTLWVCLEFLVAHFLLMGGFLILDGHLMAGSFPVPDPLVFCEWPSWVNRGFQPELAVLQNWLTDMGCRAKGNQR